MLLRTTLPEGTQLACFTDDTVIIDEALEEHIFEIRTVESMTIVEGW